jgi:GWxTD domain-containing protein
VDSTSFLDNFKRGRTLYKTEPSLIFAKDLLDEVALYYEVYPVDGKHNQPITLVLMIENNGEVILDQLYEVNPGSIASGRTLKIPLGQLNPGMHTGSITAYFDSTVDSKDFEFIVTEKTEQLHFVFSDPDQEYILMKYFISSRLPTNWTTMEKEAKRRYISQFWQVMASSYKLPIDEMMDLMNQRIQYVNKYYSHFSPGWTTDMGRIYLKNGAPNDIEKEQTSDDTKFVRKDYQIWRYTQTRNALYVFIDIQMNGNFRLIYVDNDDTESSNPDWQRYLGEEFDTDKLRN